MATIRRYRPEDLEQSRSLWADLTDWHGRLYADESIGGADPGSGFDAHLAETVLAAARAEGARQVVVRPTGRNAEAIRVFHALGFDIVARVELVHDLTGDERWRDGEDYAGRRFRV